MSILHNIYCRHCRSRTRHRVQPRRHRSSVLVCLSCHPELEKPAQRELLFVSPGGGR